MAQKNFADGQEVIFQDLNDSQTHVRRELYDRVIYHMLQKQGLGFFQDSFKVLFVDGTHVNLTAGAGFQLDGTQISPEPTHRLYYLPAISPQVLATPDGTNPRHDLVCVKAIRQNTLSESRNFKDGITGNISASSTVTETDWLSDVVIVTGTPAGSPTDPAVPSGYEKIATILVAAISGVAGQGSITDNRAIIPAGDQLYIDTTAFPAVVTPSLTARLKDVLLQLANFEFNHDTAAEIPSTPGTTAPGTNVQDRLDELDALLTEYGDVTSAVHGAFLIAYKYAAAGDWDVTRPLNVKAALDQLAARLRIAETGTNIGDFVVKAFNDYVAPADKPVGAFPNGIGNPGITSTLANNPRSLKLSELQAQWGEEKIYFHSLKQTGKYDANGLEEWEISAPHKDVRVRLYGAWTNQEEFTLNVENISTNRGQYLRTIDPSAYILITGICDGLAMMPVIYNDGADQIQVEIDTVNTGDPLSHRGSAILQNAHGYLDQAVGDLSLTGLTYGMHTFKFTNGASDSNKIMRWNGVILLTTGQKELGGAAYVNKVLQTYSPATISPPSLGGKGGKIIRYIDPADGVRKDAFSNVLEVNTSITGSVSSGSTSVTVNSATGLVSGAILEFSDGPLNTELIRCNSVNLISGALGLDSPGLLNNYTNPTVKLYAKTQAATDHSNETEKFTMHSQAFSTGQKDIQGSDQPAWIGHFASFNVIQGMTQDGVYAWTMSSGRAMPSGRYDSGMTLNGNTNVLHIDFRGTGIDLLLDFLSGADSALFDIYLDGVKLTSQTYVTPANPNHPKWIKFASDLPEGSHKLTFWCNGGTQNQVSFIAAKLYEAAQPAALATIPRANILSKRMVLADFLRTSERAIIPSKGTLKQHVWQNTIFKNTNPAATSFSWSGATYDVENHPFNGAPDFLEMDSNATNDIIQKWFYCKAGGGIEALVTKATNQGISEFKIDGLLADSGNFPGVTFQGGNGAYNTATGLFDGYAAANEYHKLSFSGLTEGWHMLQMRVTGTKNGSSSNFYLFSQGFYVIGAVMSDDLFNSGIQLTNSVSRGGVKDLRWMEAYNSENQETPVDLLVLTGPIIYGSAGIEYGQNGIIGSFESHGGDIEIIHKCNGDDGGGAGAIQIGVEVDGINYAYDIFYHAAAGWVTTGVNTMKIPLPAGRHFVRPWILGNNGTTNSSESSIKILEHVKRSAR